MKFFKMNGIKISPNDREQSPLSGTEQKTVSKRVKTTHCLTQKTKLTQKLTKNRPKRIMKENK